MASGIALRAGATKCPPGARRRFQHPFVGDGQAGWTTARIKQHDEVERLSFMNRYALRGKDMAANVEGGRLRIWADRPVSEPGEDRFGFLSYADAFALLINDKDTSTPLTVAISGPWGSGKTSLAKLLESRLKVEQYWLLD